MKPATLLFLGIFICFIACKNPNGDKVNVSVHQDSTDMHHHDTTAGHTHTEPHQVVDSATMMKAWMDFATPGDMHKWMAKYDGNWSGEVTTWMDPAAPPTKTTATMSQKMALNGLYQMGDFKGTMMGQPFMGHSILAYDNAKKEFVNTWVDNMGSGIVIMRGTYDAGTQTLSLSGTQTDPVTSKDTPIRQEIKFVDDNSQMVSMYGPGMDGKESKWMEITMKRKS